MKTIAKEGKTVFVSSHLLSEVEQVCSHVTIINHGEALVSDTLGNASRMLSGKTTLQIEVFNLSDRVEDALRALPSISAVSKKGNLLNVELETNEDVRAKVSQEITRTGGIIVSMSTKGRNLEEIFIRLVEKHQGAPTQ
jgi:ABC-2 type transport system ATP-binding protein